MNTKTILIILSRIFELTVLYIGCFWIWNNFPSPYNFWVVMSFIGVYVLYLGVTLSNDYWELTRGEGEPML
ncbi:hypothetical protein C0416_01260 [bacterium]|nr:hypothetical protein [bacterium]